MGIIRGLAKLVGYTSAAGIGTFFIVTRKSTVEELPRTDALFQSPFYRRFNPESNEVVRDNCIRRVPINQIDPSLLEKKGKLVEAFAGGVWGGAGYAIQRAYLARKYQGVETRNQLWTPRELRSSKYDVGTQVTDHFEVLEKTDDRIVFRCGDSPLKRDVRPVDGLFELAAHVKPEQGVVEFNLKSVFYQGLGKATGKAMPFHVEWLHRQYDKLLMESAIQNVLR